MLAAHAQETLFQPSALEVRVKLLLHEIRQRPVGRCAQLTECGIVLLDELGREGRTETPSYLESAPTRRGTLAWQLVVPDRRTYEKSVGDGTMVTLLRLGLLEEADDETRVVLSDYGIRTWNHFCQRGGHWPDDLVEMLP
jgi:hypothetical protein